MDVLFCLFEKCFCVELLVCAGFIPRAARFLRVRVSRTPLVARTFFILHRSEHSTALDKRIELNAAATPPFFLQPNPYYLCEVLFSFATR